MAARARSRSLFEPNHIEEDAQQDDHQMSAYEQQRLRNIKENQAMLVGLELSKSSSLSSSSSSSNESVLKRQSTDGSNSKRRRVSQSDKRSTLDDSEDPKDDSSPLRKSSRIAALQVPVEVVEEIFVDKRKSPRLASKPSKNYFTEAAAIDDDHRAVM